MLIASAQGPEKRFLVLGVTRENITRLLAGRPIRLSAESHPGIPADLVLAIVFGETEGDLMRDMRAAIGADTQIVVVPRGDGAKH
jgi:hypothetical protein